MNVGDVVGNYRITKVLGEGGMGVVYLGTHNLIGRTAAIKVLLPSLSNKQEVVQRFFNEAKTTTSIKHPGIVEVFDFGYSDEGHAFIVMEHLEGETLEQRIARLGKLPIEQAIGLFRQIARALGAAHGLNVVHRDLKPANIYIVSDPDVPGGERAKILDFGIAKLRNSGNVGVRTASGQLMGAPDYMAPEQCLGASEVDPRADLYALGCMLFHAVTGKPPFAGGSSFSDVLAAHVGKPAPRASTLTSVPGPLDDLIFQLMKKSPDDRPQNTKALIDSLEGSGGARPPAPRGKPGTAPPPVPPSARRTMMAPSQPPPIPGNSSLPPEVIDSAAPLPPLPRPKAPSAAPPPRSKAASAPPPIPRAAANAKTLFTSPNEVKPPPPAPGPLNDPRLKPGTAPPPVAGNPVLSVPGPQPDPSRPGMQPRAGMPPQPGMQPRPGMPPQPGMPAQPGMPPRPGMPPHHGQPARQPGAPVQPMSMQQPSVEMDMRPAMNAPVYPTRQPQQQPQPRRAPMPQQAIEMGPRRGHNVRPMPPPTAGGSGWKVGLGIALIVGISAGGFFIYKSASRKGSTAETPTTPTADASATVEADAGAVAAAPLDAAVVVASKLDAAPAVKAADAAVAATTPMDASVVAVAPAADAAVVPIKKTPDAAPPVAAVVAKSGRVVDPDLKSATGGDDGIETVTLVIETRPAGADVIRKHDNLLIGRTPIEFVTRKFNANEKFDLKLVGFYPVEVKISTFRDGKRLVPLLAKPK